jgi:hypothetical protein
VSPPDFVRLGNNPGELIRIAVYCENCFGFIRFGPEGGPCPEPIWIERCDRCLARAAEKEAEQERKREIWVPRECAAPDCQIVFEPRKAGQRFCCDKHRKQTHRRQKALAASSNGAAPVLRQP